MFACYPEFVLLCASAGPIKDSAAALPRIGPEGSSKVGARVLIERLWSFVGDCTAKHRAKGNGFGYGLVGPEDAARLRLRTPKLE